MRPYTTDTTHGRTPTNADGGMRHRGRGQGSGANIERRTPLTVVSTPCKGCKEGFDQLHIDLAIPIENVVVSSLVEDVERFRLRGRCIEQFRVAYMHQLVVPCMQYQRATLKIT